MGGLPRGYGIWLDHKSASPTHLFCFCLYVISCRGSFMVGFQSTLSMVVVQQIVILVFSWEEVSLGSFYSTILVDLPSRFFLMQFLHLLLFWSGIPGLPVQRTWAWSLVREDSTCRGRGLDFWSRRIPHATEQVSPCAVTTHASVHEPQLLSPCAATTEAPAPSACALQQEKPLQWEARQWMTSAPRLSQLEKALMQ